MIIPQGRHKGEAAELVVLTDPYYVRYIIFDLSLPKPFPELSEEFLRLIALFDDKPFKSRCTSCNKPATALVYFSEGFRYEPWCYECQPAWNMDSKISKDHLSDYLSGLEYADEIRAWDRSHGSTIIRNMAVSKGLPEVFGEKEALEFFANCQCENNEKLKSYE